MLIGLGGGGSMNAKTAILDKEMMTSNQPVKE
jgi:hypothetical protein